MLERRRARGRKANARYVVKYREKVSAASKAWRQANPERVRERDRRYGAAKYAAYPEREQARLTAWRQANPERHRAAMATYREAHRVESRARARAWGAAHPGRVRARVDAWHAGNPDRSRLLNRKAAAKRRARKIGSAVVEAVDITVLGERDNWTCGICGHPVNPATAWPDPASASHDHVIALANGGDHSYANAQLAHLRCNRQKGAT